SMPFGSRGSLKIIRFLYLFPFPALFIDKLKNLGYQGTKEHIVGKRAQEMKRKQNALIIIIAQAWNYTGIREHVVDENMPEDRRKRGRRGWEETQGEERALVNSSPKKDVHEHGKMNQSTRKQGMTVEGIHSGKTM
ncbi:hypothetical protein KI387_004586, partial [Taxus chinensis]